MQIDLRYLLRMGRRWWWLLLLAPIIGGATAYFVSDRQPDMYEASATLLVSTGVNASTLGSVQAGQNLTETYSVWVVSNPILERSANVLNYEGGAETLSDHVSSAPVAGTLFITVSATDTNPEQAALIANTVADQFIINFIEQTQTQNAQASSGLTERITDTREVIAQLDTTISQLQNSPRPLTTEQSAELESLRQERLRRQGELDRLEQTAGALDIELATAQTRFAVSSPAIPPTEPYAPDTARSTAIGIAVGLMLAAAAVVLLEYLDNTVRNSEELSTVTEAPVLASVASAKSAERSESNLFMLHAPKSASAEAIRLLRANLAFASATSRLTSLSITSTGPEEGKSTITANLGIAFAQAGLRTVIIDADLRRPTQHHIFGGIENARGLSTLLVEEDGDWRHAAKTLTIKNLILIPSGPIPPNPSELLSLDRFVHILEDIRAWADIVLIDGPPVLSASDALVIATKADRALLVSRMGQTRRDAARRATLSLKHADVQLMGSVLNLTAPGDIDQYDYYAESTHESTTKRLRYYYGGSHDPDLSRTIVTANGERHQVPAAGTETEHP